MISNTMTSGSSAASRAGALWAIVLAGGNGQRLATLTRSLYGTDLPKQFACLLGPRSLLQETLLRVGNVVPPERTVVVASAAHESIARRQLTEFPSVHLLVQPKNLDTAPGLLLPLMYVRRVDPSARVAVFPSDHHIPRPCPFHDAVHEAALAAVVESCRVTLLGVEPEGPETDYGWISPGAALATVRSVSLRAVASFVEKPSQHLAQRLMRLGSLWNTFVQVGRADAFLSLASATIPSHVASFERHAEAIASAKDARSLEALYAEIEPANFSRDVLQLVVSQLSVISVAGSGWSDIGTPERVSRCLESTAGTKSHATSL